MPQLASTTSGSGLSLNFRWPYQAKVMKTLEANSNSIGSSVGETVGIDVLLQMSFGSGAVPCSHLRYHLISKMRKPAASLQRSLKTGGRKACTIATIRHARA